LAPGVADPERRNDSEQRTTPNYCHPERGVGVRKGAKDRRAVRGSAPGFVRRSFAPTRAPTPSLKMTGWVVLGSRWRAGVLAELADALNVHRQIRLRIGSREDAKARRAQRWACLRSRLRVRPFLNRERSKRTSNAARLPDSCRQSCHGNSPGDEVVGGGGAGCFGASSRARVGCCDSATSRASRANRRMGSYLRRRYTAAGGERCRGTVSLRSRSGGVQPSVHDRRPVLPE